MEGKLLFVVVTHGVSLLLLLSW
jgi:hypothetical protein